MKVPICRIISVGEVTPWGKHFLELLQSENVVELNTYGTVKEFVDSESPSERQIVFIENGPESQHIVTELRGSSRRVYMVLFGKLFSKEEILFAMKNRIYEIFENVNADSKDVNTGIKRLAELHEKEKRFDLLVRSLKSVLLQAEGDVAQSVMNELKTAVGKLGTSGSHGEFAHGNREMQGKNDSKLLFHKSEDFAEALETMDSLERTGVLWVKGTLPNEEGQVGFLQGKIVSANSGAVNGIKAVYRMFLWDNPQFLFTRRDHEEMVLREPINVSMKHVAMEGAEFKRRYEKIRQELPPAEMLLELDTNFLHPGVSLPPIEFSTLASIVEFGKVSNVLDYNPLPDSLLYESLISLRKRNMIRIRA